MRVVVQRCLGAQVTVLDEVLGKVEGPALVLLVGISRTDTEADCAYLAEKVAHLRVFEDADQKMNLDVLQSGGRVLSISQFTLYGDVRKGRRPNYMEAAAPDLAQPLYETFNASLRAMGLHVETGRFGAMMHVSLVNDGPVTILLDSEKRF